MAVFIKALAKKVRIWYNDIAEDVRIRNLCGEYDTTYVYDTNAKLSRLLVKTTNGVTTKYVYGLGLIGQENIYNAIMEW